VGGAEGEGVGVEAGGRGEAVSVGRARVGEAGGGVVGEAAGEQAEARIRLRVTIKSQKG